jgi:CubicO group peptidase (beta-lactamase class C family)
MAGRGPGPGPGHGEVTSSPKLILAAQSLRSAVEAGHLGAASVVVVRKGTVVLAEGFGCVSPHQPAGTCRGVDVDSVFIMASVTKPVTAMSIMILVEEGKLSLSDPVCLYIPQFSKGKRSVVTVRDLLSHTSGLPDMLPDNQQLRERRAPLEAFVQGAIRTPLLHSPGSACSYSSMGILLAGVIVERLSGQSLREFMRSRIFEKLGMHNTSLGLGGRKVSDTVWCGSRDANGDSPPQLRNSTYWRDMGHPWGGMHSTAMDMAKLLQAMLDGGAGVWSSAALRASTSDQNEHLPGQQAVSTTCCVTSCAMHIVPCMHAAAPLGAAAGRVPRGMRGANACPAITVLKLVGGGCRSCHAVCKWGLGWALAASPQVLNSPSEPDGRPSIGRLGDLLSKKAFGHTGSVGSLAVADPVSETLCVVCSDRNAQGGSLRRRLSNLVAAAAVWVGDEGHHRASARRVDGRPPSSRL